MTCIDFIHYFGDSFLFSENVSERLSGFILATVDGQLGPCY